MGFVGNKLDNTHVTLNEREINLPGTLTIPLIYKLNVRKTIHRKELNACVHYAKAQEVMVEPRSRTRLKQKRKTKIFPFT